MEWVIILTLMPATGYALIGAYRVARWLGEGRQRGLDVRETAVR